MDLTNNLISAIIQTESAGRTEAVSPKGATGLMQLRNIAWKDVHNLYPELKSYDYKTYAKDPKINVLFGTKYLGILKNRLMKKNRYSLDNLLGAYNWGLGNLQKANYDLTKSPEETRNYITKVKSLIGGK